MTAATSSPRIMLAHDWLVGLRGGEFVLDRIASIAHSLGTVAGIVTLFDDHRPLTPTLDALPRHVSGLGRLGPVSGAARRWLLPLYPFAVDRLSDRLEALHAHAPFDLLISTSSAAIKGLRAPAGIPHVCYCHTPPRYLWNQVDAYAQGSPLRTAGLELFGDSLREWDRASASHVSTFLANSRATQAVIRHAWQRESTVLHPPVRTDHFTPPPLPKRSDAWLVVSALEPYKRIDLAIRAANQAGHPLIIAGDGSQVARLRALAGPTVTLLGRVSDAELLRLYRTCRCLLFPQIEDFGIVAVEAQSCGLPVVAFAAGGALETVVQGTTGAFFREQTPEALRRAVTQCPAPDAPALRAHAESFSEPRFDHEFRALIAAALGASHAHLPRSH